MVHEHVFDILSNSFCVFIKTKTKQKNPGNSKNTSCVKTYIPLPVIGNTFFIAVIFFVSFFQLYEGC